MGWLGLKKRPGHGKDEGDQVDLEPRPLQALTPVLNLLVPDIAGVTSFHLRQFFDVPQAEEFIQTLPSISGLHAFWGLSEPPPGHQEDEGTGEAMVLIRSAQGSDTVYVVSFVDLDAALSFARFEVKRGMALDLLLIYWAEIVEVDVDEHGIRLSPNAPPLPGYEARHSWTQVDDGLPADSTAVAEAGPEHIATAGATPLAAIAGEPSPTVIEETEEEEPQAAVPNLGWDTETSEAFEQETAEEFEQFVAEQEELRAAEQEALEAAPEAPREIQEQAPELMVELVEKPESARSEPEAIAIEEPEAAAVEPEPISAEVIERVVPVEPDAEVRERLAEAIGEPAPAAAAPEAEARSKEEIDIEGEAIAFLKASADGKKSAAASEALADEPVEVVAEVAPAPEPEPVAEPQAIAEPAEEPVPALQEPETPQPAVPVRTPVGAAVHDGQESEEELTEDLVEEVEKILKVKRWDKRESPFRGFDSPPGRF